MAIIQTGDLSHIYMRDTPFETVALRSVNLSIERGEVVGIVGPTGCGKSTLVQHFNGLLRPTSGTIIIDGMDITSKTVDLYELRRRVGLVFQYPEHQLFEETVYDDIAFGPRNMGFSQEEIRSAVKDSLEFMDLSYEKMKDRSPFSLSGGEMRRVALAGVLAMRPEILVLDEPTAGLDPLSRRKLIQKIRDLQKTLNTTIVIVSHEIEEIAEISHKVVVMKEGMVLLSGPLKEIFSSADALRSASIILPQYTMLMRQLKEIGKVVREDVLTIDEAFDEVLRLVRKG